MKKTFFAIALAAAVMVGLPYLAVKFVQGSAGMAVVFLLFFALDPVCALFMGVFAGRAVKTRWYLPLLTSALFLAGTWLFFDPHESAFLLYAAIYLGLGLAAMLVTALVRRARAKERNTSSAPDA